MTKRALKAKKALSELAEQFIYQPGQVGVEISTSPGWWSSYIRPELFQTPSLRVFHFAALYQIFFPVPT
jgi:hypothetical protein